jgi:hypothetical protein
MTVDGNSVTRIFNHIRDKFPSHLHGGRFDYLGVMGTFDLRRSFLPYDDNGMMYGRYASQYQNVLRIQYEKEKAKDWNKAQEVH